MQKKKQSKVVQKYVERPLLIGNKKFDLRQWVLVTSWEPLDVYVFDTAYLRLCTSTFTLNDLSDVYRHLSNYTIQKTNTEQNDVKMNDGIVMSIDEFEENKQVNWKEVVFPKIQ